MATCLKMTNFPPNDIQNRAISPLKFPLKTKMAGILLWVFKICFWSVALSYLSAWAAQDSKGNSNFVGLKRKWAHALLVPGRVYLTPKGGDPRPPVLPPTSTTHNRLLTKLNKRIVMWLKYINMRIGFCGHFPYDSGLFLGCGAVWRHWIQTQQRNEESFRRRLILFCFDK